MIPYTLTFHHVLAYFACELETYLNTEARSHAYNTSFNVAENSKWLTSLPIRTDLDRSKYKHYQLFTYDNVYDIIALSFDMKTDLS